MTNDEATVAGPNPRGDGSQELLERGRRVARDAGQLGNAVADFVTEGRHVLTALMRERPYIVLAGAAGTGFVLAGGLRSRFTRTLVGTASRLLVSAALRRAFVEQPSEKGIHHAQDF